MLLMMVRMMIDVIEIDGRKDDYNHVDFLFIFFLISLYIFFYSIENGIYCELNQSQCITYIIPAYNNRKPLKVLEESIQNLSSLIKPIISSDIPLELSLTTSYNFNNQLTYGYLACSHKYYTTRKVSLFTINSHDSYDNDNKSMNDNDDNDNNKKIDINKYLINKISAETVNLLMIIIKCD